MKRPDGSDGMQSLGPVAGLVGGPWAASKWQPLETVRTAAVWMGWIQGAFLSILLKLAAINLS